VIPEPSGLDEIANELEGQPLIIFGI